MIKYQAEKTAGNERVKDLQKQMNFPVNTKIIEGKLTDKYGAVSVVAVQEVGSTNDELKKPAYREKKENILLIAQRQTSGKGRMGRSFYSPDKSGIYMSLLLHPDLEAEKCTLLTSIAAVAVSKAIENVLGVKADIKWVNDIYIGGKKVAGILTESAFNGKRISYSVVGIGINITMPEEGFPEEIKDIASAVMNRENENSKNDLIAEIINTFMYYYSLLPENEFIGEYRKRLIYLGEEITVISPKKSYRAVAADIDEMCRLKVRLENGEERIVHSGEISIRK